jgi:hypothetical protein
MKNIISLGAGVQSSTLAMMAAHGEVTPMPDCAIFADTMAEPLAVYKHLDWLETQLPYPVHRVCWDDLEAKAVEVVPRKKDGKRYIRGYIPAFMESGLLSRTCTGNFKIFPVKRKVKELLGLRKQDRWPKEHSVTIWLGISMDEIQRMKVSVDPWQKFAHPLIDKKMTRQHCKDWMVNNGYPVPPRSACIFCPFRSNEEWLNLDQPDFLRAVEFENKLQNGAQKSIDDGILQDLPYLHSSRIPIGEVNFTSQKDNQFDWIDECEGMCGV